MLAVLLACKPLPACKPATVVNIIFAVFLLL